jgi:hypothetical protein
MALFPDLPDLFAPADKGESRGYLPAIAVIGLLAITAIPLLIWLIWR